MAKIIECIPNISEGRDSEIIESVVDAVRNAPGVALLDYSSDPSHNRSVITFMGEPGSVARAAVELAGKAALLIDLTKHRGEHPRMGAVDVIPFVPIRETSMEECAKLAVDAAEQIWGRYALPAYLYERAARIKGRENLSDIRRGQFEGMAEKMKKPGWAPDFGDPAPHPTAGVVAVGARRPLVAFNMNLNTPDIEIAKAIAKTIRQSNGGWANVKAIGIMLKERGIAQVSVNMTDICRTPLYRVLEAVRFEARRWGAEVAGTEIIGLAPMSALVESAEYYLKLEHFDGCRQIMENHLQGTT